MVIDKSNRLWTWGWNEHGNLNLGHDENMYEPVEIKPLLDPKAYVIEDVTLTHLEALCSFSC